MIYLQLFWEYFKIGLFAIGGGQATIPFLVALSEKTGWYTIGELTDMIAISESTPGPIGVNMATYVGYSIKGIPGSITASLGLVAPSIIIIIIIAGFLQKFRHNKYVEQVFYGIRPASTGLIAAALFSLIRLCMFNVNAFKMTGVFSDLINLKYLILFVVLIAASNLKKLKKLHPLVFIAFSAVVGIVFSFAEV